MVSKLHKPRKWLAAAACLSAAFPVFADTETVGDYTWTYHIENGGAVIYKGYEQNAISPSPSGHMDIPATLGGCPVVRIGNWALEWCVDLTSVSIPQSIEVIGHKAFSQCSMLGTVVFEGSEDNIYIDPTAFDGTPYSATVPFKLIVKDGVLVQFRGSCPATIEIPEGTTAIADEVFYCSSHPTVENLKQVHFNDELKNIGSMAFYNCPYLGSIEIPASVTNIGYSAFAACYSVTNIVLNEGLISVQEGAFGGGTTSEITLPRTVRSISREAFLGTDGTVTVHAHDSLYGILESGDVYQEYWSGEAHVHTTKVEVVFYGESQYFMVTLDENGGEALEEPAISIIENRAVGTLPTPTRTGYVFSGWWTAPDGGERVTSDTVVTADMTLYAHWQEAPYDNWRGYAPWIVEEDGSWRSGDIGDEEYSAIDVYFVGPAEVSFKWKTSSESGCDSLRYTVCVPDGALFGGDYYTETLTGSISGEMAEWESRTLQVPESGDCHLSFSYEKDGSVSNGEDCGWVKELVFSELQVPSAGFTFEENSSGGVTLTGVSDASGDVVIPSEYNGLPVTAIGDNAFRYRSGLTSVIIPDSVTNIGSGAFFHCNDLANVALGNSVTNIADHAFDYCSSLTSVTIPDSVTSIGNYAFRYCSGLTSIIIPDSVTSIGIGAFYKCNGLADYNGFVIVRDVLYSFCGQSESVVIPDSVTSIGESAFGDCTNLTSVTIPDSVTSIGSDAFAWCSGLMRVTIPASVTRIGDEAFAWCSQLAEVIFEGNESDIEMNKYIAFAMTPWLPRPGNDEYENAQIVEGSEGSVAGTLAGATIADNDCIWQYGDAERTIWYKWTATFTGLAGFSATADNGENDLLYLVATRGFDYETEEWDDCGYDNGCNVTFQVTEGEFYYVSIATWNYDVTGLTISWGEYIPPPPPANDNFADALPLAGASGSASGTNEDATYEAEEYRPVGDSSATVWWTWRAPYSGTATFDMSGSSFDTVLAVFTGDELASLSLVASDDDSGDGGNTSRLSFNAEAGTLYRIWVGGYDDSTGEYVLAWSLEGDGVSVAAEGVSQEYASEAEAQSASETLAVAVPREVAAVVADAAEYRSYFAKTVRETSPGSGSYVVEATLDPAKVLPQDAEEKAALDGAVLEAALDAEAGETTLTGAKPGLYYSIVADTDLAGSFSTGGEPALCGADGSVTISKPDVSGLNGSAVFFRVKIDAYAR